VELPCGAGFSFAARSNDGLLQVVPAAAAVVARVSQPSFPPTRDACIRNALH
jgi:hypothetical protein